MPSLPVEPAPVLSTVSRSGRVESWHRGALAVWHRDQPWLLLGDAAAPVFCRSAVKPLQALPFCERGLPERLHLGDRELALLCASHDGTQEQVDVVRGFLQRGGLCEDQLGCGPHAPFDPQARQQLLRDGLAPTRLHNNCSGKHTGFLHLAAACGDDLAQYLDPHCNSQQEVAAAVAAMAGVPTPLETGVDGCGAPTFVLPLLALARAFARLADPSGLPAARAAACTRLLAVAGREPVLLAGPRRFCTALLRALPGRAFCKNGAEGVYAVALRPDPARRLCPGGVGIAIKAHDGNERGYQPVIVDLLLQLGAFGEPGAVPPALAEWHVQPVKNTRGAVVGDARCAVDWAALRGGA